MVGKPVVTGDYNPYQLSVLSERDFPMRDNSLVVWPRRIAFTVMALAVTFAVTATAEAELIIDETFDTDTPNTATTLTTYPEFTYSGGGAATVVGGQLNLTTSGSGGGNRNFFFTTPVSPVVKVEADITKNPAGGSFNSGLVIGDNNLIFHPGYGGGAFRIEGPGGVGNQNMGFTPAGFPTIHQWDLDIDPVTGIVDVEITDGDNLANVFMFTSNPIYTPGDRIGFTVEGGGGNLGIFDNLRITDNTVAVIPEPSTFGLAVLGLLGLGWYGRRRRRRAA